jgi:hypothetical protein
VPAAGRDGERPYPALANGLSGAARSPPVPGADRKGRGVERPAGSPTPGRHRHWAPTRREDVDV